VFQRSVISEPAASLQYHVSVIAAIHMSPAVTVPAGLFITLLLAWYWHSMGLPDVPSSRRRIRRVSLGFIEATLICLVLAMSFIDHTRQPSAYVFAWTGVLLLLLVVMVTAVIDLINNMRLQEFARQDRVIEAAAEAARIRRTREDASDVDGGNQNDRPESESKHG